MYLQNNQNRNYNYNYDVKDADSSVDYGQQETSDGKGSVSGKYHVLLSDGRRQSVTYTANENGYVADVQYEGEAQNYETPFRTDTYSTPYYPNKERKNYETPNNIHPVNPYTPVTKYPDTYSTTTAKYHQTDYVKGNETPHNKQPDTYSTPYKAHQTYHPKGYTHSGSSYSGQDNYQVPYVKEHGLPSTKYHTNNPYHLKYPHAHSHPYGKSETHYSVAKGYTNPNHKYPENNPTPYNLYQKICRLSST